MNTNTPTQGLINLVYLDYQEASTVETQQTVEGFLAATLGCPFVAG